MAGVHCKEQQLKAQEPPNTLTDCWEICSPEQTDIEENPVQQENKKELPNQLSYERILKEY